MQGWCRVLIVVAAIGSLSITAAVLGESSADGKAVFARREDTMKRMGRPLYLNIGRVVKGTTPYGPDTVTAAETVASLASSLDRTLFAPGSNVADSKIKPAIFAAGDQVGQLLDSSLAMLVIWNSARRSDAGIATGAVWGSACVVDVDASGPCGGRGGPGRARSISGACRRMLLVPYG